MRYFTLRKLKLDCLCHEPVTGELAERHSAMYERAMQRAQTKGWNAELDDDD